MNKIKALIEQRETAYDQACEEVQRTSGAYLEMPDKTPEQQRSAAFSEVKDAEFTAEKTKELLEEARSIERAQQFSPVGLDGAKTGEGVMLRNDQKIADYLREKGRGGEELGEKLSLGKFLRGMATGDWKNAGGEQRAVNLGTIAGGGALVPEILSAQLIDLARAKSVAMRAGVVTVPCETEQTHIARLTGEPSGEWHTELGSLSDEDLTFDRVTFTAKTATVLVKASHEVLADSRNLEQVISQEFAKLMALKMDRAILIGNALTGQSEPQGIINTLDVLSDLVPGTWTNFDPIVDAVGSLRSQNFEPNALIANPTTHTFWGKLKDNQDNPLKIPTDVAELSKFSTTSFASEGYEDYVLTGDFSQCLVGIRQNLVFEIFRDTMIEDLSVAFLAHLRMDVQLAHAEAFHFLSGSAS